MREALEQRSGEAQQLAVSIAETIPAPIRGWNLVDPIARMEPEYAILLDNWIPRLGYCAPRRGQSAYATGFAQQVFSLIPYSPPLGSARKLFAAAGTGFFDVSAGGAIGASVYTITQSRNWINQPFSTFVNNYVSAVNGADPAAKYDGAAWTAQAITGVSSSTLSYVTAHQQRLWFIQKDTLDAWFLASGSIEGAATRFSLTSQARLGGKLVAVTTWSPDAGTGLNDHLIFLTDMGEVIVYQGVDPNVPGSFLLVGTYRIPKPFGVDPFVRYGPDVLILTQQGVYPLSKSLQTATIDKTTAITYLISPQFASDFAQFGGNYGWMINLYTEDNLLIVNAPGANGDYSDQYVMNTLSGAWCRFRGISANCWASFNGVLYFGGLDASNNLIVGKALQAIDDFGAVITASMLTAYNYFGASAVNKRVNLIRPNLIVDKALVLGIAVSTDFDQLVTYQTAQISQLLAKLGGSFWDSGIWDTSTWGISSFTPLQWRSVYSKSAFALAVGLQTMTQNATIQLVSFDLLLEPGGPL